MVPIFKNIEPKELSDYIQEQKSLGLTPSFSDFTKGVKPAIQKAVCEEQGYICAYCMQRIEPDGQHMKIEHWDTQASNKATPERTVDYSIMLGCCLGKIEKNESCDTFRGHIKKIENQQLKYNPADKTHHNLLGISYEPNGKIHSFDSGFDKQQGSFKAVTTPTAVKQDLVISCYKPSETFSKQFMIQDSRANTWSFVSEHLEHLPIPAVKDERTTSVIERSPKVLYDRLITYFFMRGLPVPIDAADFQEGLRNRYIQEDGMIFTSAQLNQYHELKKRHNITDQPSLFVSIIESENDAIQWIKEKLEAGPLKYQDIQPDYRKAYTINRKGEVEVELKDVLEENFIQESDGSWRIPDMNEQKDRDALRTKALLKIWEDYCSQIESGKAKKLKDVRLEAVKAGFKDSYQKKDFKRIVTIGDKIPENLLTEDETLLNYYDIASSKV